MIVEVGLKLNKPLEYYHEILLAHGAENTFNCNTHDLYWTNQDLSMLTESGIKSACVRYRRCRKIEGHDNSEDGEMQNFQIFNPAFYDTFICPEKCLSEYEELFKKAGWKKVFDTKNQDYQYKIGNMKSRIQLQHIEGYELYLYYDNPALYYLPSDAQRMALIDELNSYGFNFTYDTLGFDKLRSMHSGTICQSKNQAG
jgi:hypothetical protein